MQVSIGKASLQDKAIEQGGSTSSPAANSHEVIGNVQSIQPNIAGDLEERIRR